MKQRDLFRSDITRSIPPVVSFSDLDPDRLADEVSEYIITGGWPDGHPNHTRVPSGIHEQYVRLLRQIVKELDRSGGPDLPTSWISGFYGSGKSSFAKLLGLALDGRELPDGRTISEAWIARDFSPRAQELRDAWAELRARVEPIAVVFDIGTQVNGGEHVHDVILRRVQDRLGYSKAPSVARYELTLERESLFSQLDNLSREHFGQPWKLRTRRSDAADDFSLLMSHLRPEHFPTPTSWSQTYEGKTAISISVVEAVTALHEMLARRAPRATLFLIIDEVSQFLRGNAERQNSDRPDRLRSLASELGAQLKGKVWLLALGQQRIEEQEGESFLAWAKDRFPPQLRVHLETANIREVVHRRLLAKTPEAEAQLRALFEQNRQNLSLYGYRVEAETVTPEEFIESYPLLPGYFDLILQITSHLRHSSKRAQGDDQAIRGILQLIGELFGTHGFADEPFDALVTLDRIYDVQATALREESQKVLDQVRNRYAHQGPSALPIRVAKVVALLEHTIDDRRVDDNLVAQLLYARLDQPSNRDEVQAALSELRAHSFLSYSEKQGYKLQSSTGQDWEKEREAITVSHEALHDLLIEALKHHTESAAKPELGGRPFPYNARYSGETPHRDRVVLDPRKAGHLAVHWLSDPSDDPLLRSGESGHYNDVLWVVQRDSEIRELASDLVRSKVMIERNRLRREGLSPERRHLFSEEEVRKEDLTKALRKAVGQAWLHGKIAFRGRTITPVEFGNDLQIALNRVAEKLLPEIYVHFNATSVTPAEISPLYTHPLSGISTKFMKEGLGIFDTEDGHYVAVLTGEVPSRVREFLEREGSVSGAMLLGHFDAPPFGYSAELVKACVAGAIHAGKLILQGEGGAKITAVRDPGTKEIFSKEGPFRKTTCEYKRNEKVITPQVLGRIAELFRTLILPPGADMAREASAIADAVFLHFPRLQKTLSETRAIYQEVHKQRPPELEKLGKLLDNYAKNGRETDAVVRLVADNLTALKEGLTRMKRDHAELSPEVVEQLHRAHSSLNKQGAQLNSLGNRDAAEAIQAIHQHLAGEAPWREIAAIASPLDQLEATYSAVREALLVTQEHEAEEARKRIRSREGFSKLSAEQSHKVLRPITEAVHTSSDSALSPALVELGDAFLVRLRRAEETANETLDELLSEGDNPVITAVKLNLRNREVQSEAQIDALVAEIRNKLLEVVQRGGRVRLS